MAKKSSQNQKNSKPKGEEINKKWLFGIVIGVVVIAIAAIAYFTWPKTNTTQVTELKIEDIAVGTGREVKTGDTLTVEYTGWLLDKYNIEPFDKSSLHEKPFEFVLGQGDAILGWDQGLVGMKVGGTRKLIIPAEMGYGATGSEKGRIPPNSALVFEVKLLQALGPAPATLQPTTITELKIEDLLVGTGAEAQTGNTLSVHYTGWLENGSQFDSSIGGQPIEFILGKGQVIPGWEQGFAGMKVGGKRRLTIPPALAYGKNGAGDVIPADATLIFEIELVEIK